MKKKMQIMTIICLLIILTGCGNQKVRENIDYNVDGKLHCGYFYQEDKIELTSNEHFWEAYSWNPVEFDYICQELTCIHKSSDCGAGFISYNRLLEQKQENTSGGIFSFEYAGKRIIIDTYFDGYEAEQDDELSLYKCKLNYRTEIYEAKLDGSNRKLVMSFDGGIQASNTSFAAIVHNGKVYFGGVLNLSADVYIDEKTTLIKSQTSYVEHAFYEIDLTDYSVQMFGREKRILEEGYHYQVHQCDDWIYMSRYNSNVEKADWYIVNSNLGQIQESVSFDAEAPRILGGIEDSVIAYRNNVLYRYDWMEKEMKELYCGSEEEELIAFVLADEIWIATDKSLEKGNDFVEYTILDKEGNILRTNYYSEYITFLDVIGERVIYFKPLTDGIEEWWCGLDRISTLEDSVYIGSFLRMDME